MKKMLLSIVLILISSNWSYGQQPVPPSIHQIEYEKNYNVTPIIGYDLNIPIKILQKRSVLPQKEVFGYLPYWVSPQYLRWSYLTTLAYFGLEFDRFGNIVKYNGWPPTSLINQAHNNGVRVVVVAINFNPDDIHNILTNSNIRDNFIDNLIAEMKKGNADGVNIDFELPPSSDRDVLTDFMSVLASRCHQEIPGSHVSIAMPAVNWSNRFDYSGLAAACDALMIMGYNYWYKGSSTAGPVSPLSGSTYNVTRTVNEYLQQTSFAGEKIILGLPYYGIEWNTSSDQAGSGALAAGVSKTYQVAAQNAASYGRRWNDLYKTPWYAYLNNNNWYQCWYDDSLSLSYKYNLALEKQLAGIGIWALGYDGSRPELWGAIQDHFLNLDSLPPNRPTHFAALAIENYNIRIKFHQVENATEYQLFISPDGATFIEDTTFFNTNMIDIQPPGNNPVYLKLRAVNNIGVSDFTEVLGVTVSAQKPRILIVNGFDRVSGTGNTFDFIRQHGQALFANDQTFSSASNEAILSRDVSLLDFDLVDWILGEEGVATESFSLDEQSLVKEYLEDGKSLFVSGSEIGYDLFAKGSQQDVLFFQNYLRAEYIVDGVKSYRFNGSISSFFFSIPSMSFDNGLYGGYDVDYPDGIKPFGGSQLGLVYGGVDYNNNGGAGIYYQGTFGQSLKIGKLVFFAFPFEMIIEETNRELLMRETLKFFDFSTKLPIEDSKIPDKYLLLKSYPNPVYLSESSIFKLSVQTNNFTHPVRITLYNSLGQHVKTIYSGKFFQSQTEIFVNIAYLNSGIYFIRAFGNKIVQKKRIVILR